MASVTNDEKNAMAEQDVADEGEEREPQKQPAPRPEKRGSGFFTIHKKGQGYWTRMGTAIGAAIVGAFTAYNIYEYLPTLFHFSDERMGAKVGLAAALAFVASYSFIVWRLMNKPSNVDFLIATDSEMKKVNWTSRKELIGSTKVVVIFMFLTALFLFVVDLVFGELMHLIHVLNQGPLGS